MQQWQICAACNGVAVHHITLVTCVQGCQSMVCSKSYLHAVTVSGQPDIILLIKLTPKGVVFSFSFLFSHCTGSTRSKQEWQAQDLVAVSSHRQAACKNIQAVSSKQGWQRGPTSQQQQTTASKVDHCSNISFQQEAITKVGQSLCSKSCSDVNAIFMVICSAKALQ